MANKIYNEDWLAEEIKKTWGEFGAHYDVYKEVLKRAKVNIKLEITKQQTKKSCIATTTFLNKEKVYMTQHLNTITKERFIQVEYCPSCQKEMKTNIQLLPNSIFSLHCTKCNFDLLNPLKQ